MNRNKKLCYGNPTTLRAQGGSVFRWHRLNMDGRRVQPAYLDRTDVHNPNTDPALPVGSHRFRVVSTGACDLKDSADVNVSVGYLEDPGVKLEREFDCGSSVTFSFRDTTSNKDLGLIVWYVQEAGASNPPSTDDIAFEVEEPSTEERGFTYTAVNTTDQIKYFDITREVYDDQLVCSHVETKRVGLCDLVCTANRTPRDPNGCHPDTVDFWVPWVGGYTGGITYEWDFDGDGDTDAGVSDTFHVYENYTGVPQTYTPTLTVRNDQGCEYTVVLNPITVQPWLRANFAIDTEEACSPMEQDVVDNSMGGIASYIWDKTGAGFQMGNLVSSAAPADWRFQMTNNGSAAITTRLGLRVFTENGQCYSDYAQPITVHPTPTTAAAMSTLSDPNCSPLRLRLEGRVSGPGKHYRWEESSDGGATWKTIATTADVPEYELYNYGASAQVYRFRFTVTGDYACGSTVNVGQVTVQPHIEAQLGIDTSVCAPDVLRAHVVRYAGITRYSIDWGDGSAPNVYDGVLPPDEVEHPYGNTGSATARYDVVYTVQNRVGCTQSRTQPVYVFPEVQPGFEPPSALGCSPVHVQFTNTTRYMDGSALSGAVYEWDFGNGNSSYLRDPEQDFHNGMIRDTTYTVRLVTRSEHGCHDTVRHAVTVQPSVTAYMAVDASSGCSPLRVRFDYKVLPSISSYRFIWDDGTAEEVVGAAGATGVIEHTFINETDASIVRNVRMEATNANCSAEMVLPITVHAAITAGYAQGATTGCSPLSVQLTDATKYRNGVAVADALYYWDFGDGSSSIEASPLHTFENNGDADVTYTVTQRVTTQEGCASSSSSTVTVSPFIAAQLAINRCEGCTPLSVDFSYPTHPSVDQYAFSWGDGQTASLSGAQATGAISHTYTNTTGQPEGRTARLTISNARCTDDVELPLRVYPAIAAGFSADVSEGCTDLTVSFTNSSRFEGSSGAPMTAADAEYYWDFGDGTQSTEYSPTHVFRNRTGGDVTYAVSLRVRLYQTNMNGERVYSGCESTYRSTVKVWPFVDATVTLSTVTLSTDEGCSPLAVDFAYTRHDGVATYTFGWGDGTPSATIAGGSATGRAAHTFVNQSGAVQTRTVAMAVSNGKSGQAGCTMTDQVQVTVYPEVQADFVADRYEGCTDLDVQLTNQSVYRGTTIPVSNHRSYWSFGDGGSSEEHSPAHTYTNDNVGGNRVYPTALLVESEHGCTDQVTKNIEVYNRVESHFTFDQPSACTPFEVTFTSGALGAASLEWSFGGAPNLSNHTMGGNGAITRTFENPSADDVARYDVSLTVRNAGGCTSTETRTIEVYPQVVAAFSKSEAEGCSGLEVDFTNTSTGGALMSKWSFGDGQGTSNDTKAAVRHAYHNTGAEKRVYTVELTAINPHGCRDATTQEITVHPEVRAEFSWSAEAGCTPLTVALNNESSTNNAQTNTYTRYEWDFGDGTRSTQARPGDHVYVNPTNPPVVEAHTVTLEVTYERDGRTCTDRMQKEFTVYPHIYPDFTGDLAGCHPHPVQLSNTTVSYSGATTSYLWDMGYDNLHTSEVHPSLTYSNTSNVDNRVFDIRLLARSEHGCEESVVKQVTVYPRPYAAMEMVGSYMSCPPFSAEFDNNSIGADLKYTYSFGDGYDSVTTSPANMRHAYQNPTSDIRPYHVNLHVESAYGCDDQVQQTVYVYPAVQVDYTLDPSAGCSPHMVAFNSSATRNAKFYEWDFDDGITSSTPSPEHSFENIGEQDRVYDVTLYASSEYGCSDALTKQVTVYATPRANFAVTPPQSTYPDATFGLDNQSVPAAGSWRYHWSFGDGYTSAEKHPMQHTYLTWGPREDDFKYTITLRIESPRCSSSTSNTIWLYAPRPVSSFSSARYRGCSPLEVNLVNSSKYADTYLWDFGDGTTSTEFEPFHVFEYDPQDTINNGNYLVSLTVYGDGGMHFEQQQFQVYRNPEAAFTTAPANGVVQLPNAAVGFINESQHYDPPLSYWDFGDGSTAMGASPRHEYAGMGEYRVSLWVYQAYDDGTVCADSISRNPAVWVQAPGTIEFPNAFKPSLEGGNGGAYEPNDIKNQVFHPLHKGVAGYRLIIMSRWGEQMFTSKDVHVGWDGYVNGRLAPQGVYVWRATGTFVNGQAFDKRGTVTLIR